jgi:uncharacterized protein YggE
MRPLSAKCFSKRSKNERYTAFMSKKAPFLLVVSASLAFAQLDSNSITVSASRSATLQPDQALFAVSVQSDLNTSLNDVLAALQGSGITSANFSGVSTSSLSAIFISGPITSPPGPTIQWTFGLPVPLTKTKDTVAALTALQQNIAQNNKSLKLSFSIQGTQVSQQLQQSQTCSIPDLLTDARTQAQTLAVAGGVTLGTILAMSSPTSSAAIFPNSYPINTGISFSSAFAPAPCVVTVKFAVTRFQ